MNHQVTNGATGFGTAQAAGCVAATDLVTRPHSRVQRAQDSVNRIPPGCGLIVLYIIRHASIMPN